ncbi:MAG: SDR family oxidoreductase [Dehalococcoidales bacterium]|nr:MAG: SDR family oxidoreductase [Dehalococcoidales bacterium]
MMMKNVVITGSTSGIGYGLAESFLSTGCSVIISGRSAEKLDSAYKNLAGKYGEKHVFSFLCDVTEYLQVQSLWDAASSHFSMIDIWINNAGVAHAETDIFDYSPELIQNVVNTNITGAIFGSKIALKGMKEQNSGSIYNMEGLGSDGRIIPGMALYGVSKSALAYLTKAMAKETKGTPIITGGIRPGMVATKLVTGQYEGHPEDWEKVKGIFNILSERVEIVTPWITKKVIKNKKNGAIISYLTTPKLIKRFVLAPFVKRNIFD